MSASVSTLPVFVRCGLLGSTLVVFRTSNIVLHKSRLEPVQRVRADLGYRLRRVRHTGGVTSQELLELISIDPNVCHGQPCIRGTRVLVTVVLDALAAGLSPADIVGHYPTIDEDGVRAAAAYGAWLAKQEVHGLPAGS